MNHVVVTPEIREETQQQETQSFMCSP